MPKGPNGEKRPADVIGAAVLIGRIATGDASEDLDSPTPAAELGRKGGKARAEQLSKAERTEAARAAANARWKRST